MAIDSTADLLFRIAADTGDAESNITRFRAVLGKDLDGIASEFSGWANKVFGQLTSLKGITTAGAAALAAGAVAVTAAVSKATDRYAEYVTEVGKASKASGIGITDMSHLAVAADNTQTSMEALTRGLGFFAAQVVKANAGGEEQIKTFGRMGVTREQLANGERNLYPLLEQVSQKFHDLKSGTEAAGMARELFSRNGTELLNFLRLGRDGLKGMADEAKRLGLELTSADVEAVKRLKAAKNELEDRKQAIDVAVGRATIDLKTKWETFWAAFAATVTNTGDAKGMGFLQNLTANFGIMSSEIDKTAKAMANLRGTDTLEPVAEKAKKTKDEFYGLSSILDSIKGKLAGTQGDEARVDAEISHLMNEVGRAAEEYRKLEKEGKLTAESAEREAAVLMSLPAAISALGKALRDQVAEKARLEQEQAAEDLRQRLEGQAEQTYEQQERSWSNEIERLRIQLEKKKLLTEQNAAALAELEAAGRARIARDRQAAFAQELAQVQQHQAQIVTAQMTSAERIQFEYEQEAARYSEVEERKALKLAGSEGERLAIQTQFAMMRELLYAKEQNDLLALRNSQGWNGVWGNAFAQLIRGDEALLREWATSANQSLLMVRVTMEGLGDVGRRSFQQLAQGMGQNVASAFIYQKSIGQAMRAALASTLESISAESMMWAIYSTALGFLRLAQRDYPGASAAFTSAAIWGSVGAAAAVAGRAVAPSQGSQTAGGGAEAAGGGGSAETASGSGSTEQRRPTVQVIVQGHVFGVSGVQELAAAINDAVLNRDVQLTATNTKTGVQVTR